MKKLILAATLIMPVQAQAAQTVYEDSTDYYYKVCQVDITQCTAFFGGYDKGLIMGIILANKNHGLDKNAENKKTDNDIRGMRGCFDEPLQTEQMVKIWMKFVEDNPKVLNLAATATFSFSNLQAYPCP